MPLESFISDNCSTKFSQSTIDGLPYFLANIQEVSVGDSLNNVLEPISHFEFIVYPIKIGSNGSSNTLSTPPTKSHCNFCLDIEDIRLALLKAENKFPLPLEAKRTLCMSERTNFSFTSIIGKFPCVKNVTLVLS